MRMISAFKLAENIFKQVVSHWATQFHFLQCHRECSASYGPTQMAR